MCINPADDEKLDKKKRRKTDKEFVFQFEDMKINSNQEINNQTETKCWRHQFCHLKDKDITSKRRSKD